MSHTPAPRRARSAKHDRDRAERREALHVLLARADRGALSHPEGAQLRALVEAELDEGDAARRAAGGQQAAVRREQRRLAAAEAAIREIEADRDRLAHEGADERRCQRAEQEARGAEECAAS